MANKRQRKKRMKKELKKLAEMKPLSKVAVPVITSPPSTALYLGKYKAENEQYQAQLDQVYNGTIQPIERFINPNAILLHHCKGCDKEFYSAGKLLLNPLHKHVCHSIDGASTINHKEGKKSVNSVEMMKRIDRMVWADYHWKDIAKELRVYPKIIKDYFIQEGLI